MADLLPRTHGGRVVTGMAQQLTERARVGQDCQNERERAPAIEPLQCPRRGAATFRRRCERDLGVLRGRVGDERSDRDDCERQDSAPPFISDALVCDNALGMCGSFSILEHRGGVARLGKVSTYDANSSNGANPRAS